MQNNNCELLISDIRMWVNLGVGQEEKHNKQLVSIDIVLFFKKPPLACSTDKLQDTICYERLVVLTKEVAGRKAFSLIEHLAAEIYSSVLSEVSGFSDNVIDMKIIVHKLAPPVEGLHGGTKFVYTR